MLNIIKEYNITGIAGTKGLSTRFIKTCVVIDVPDAHLWVHGGEFLITSGYLFYKNPLELLELIEGSALAGAAALGIKIGRFIGDLPKQVIELADKLDFPLLNIPPQVNHSDLITQVLSVVVNARFKVLSQSSTIQDFFINQVVSGSPIENILDGYERFTNCPIQLLQDGSDVPVNSQGMKKIKDENSISPQVDTLTFAGKHVGTLRYLNQREPSDELAKVALVNAKTALMILIQQNLALHDAEKRHSEDLLRDLLFRRGMPIQDQIALSSLIGWAHEGQALAALIKIPEQFLHNRSRAYDLDSFSRICANTVKIRIKNALFTELSGTAVFVLPVENETADEYQLYTLMDSIRKEIEGKESLPLIVALGSIKESLVKVSESYVEARETLEILERSHSFRKTARWDEMDLERILILIHGTDAGRNLIQKCLGPLLHEDKTHISKSSGLVDTLDAYAENNWSMKETAEKLSIHYNTLKYRLQKITLLTGLDIQDSQTRIEMSIALALLKMNNKTQ
jgi:purine catabolism regulator